MMSDKVLNASKITKLIIMANFFLIKTFLLHRKYLFCGYKTENNFAIIAGASRKLVYKHNNFGAKSTTFRLQIM